MSRITIRNLNSQVISQIKILAKINGRSMEGEIRAMLTAVTGLGPSDLSMQELNNRIAGVQRSNLNALYHATKSQAAPK